MPAHPILDLAERYARVYSLSLLEPGLPGLQGDVRRLRFDLARLEESLRHNILGLEAQIHALRQHIDPLPSLPQHSNQTQNTMPPGNAAPIEQDPAAHTWEVVFTQGRRGARSQFTTRVLAFNPSGARRVAIKEAQAAGIDWATSARAQIRQTGR